MLHFFRPIILQNRHFFSKKAIFTFFWQKLSGLTHLSNNRYKSSKGAAGCGSPNRIYNSPTTSKCHARPSCSSALFSLGDSNQLVLIFVRIFPSANPKRTTYPQGHSLYRRIFQWASSLRLHHYISRHCLNLTQSVHRIQIPRITRHHPGGTKQLCT